MRKRLSDSKILQVDRENRLVHCYFSAWGYLPIEPPVMAFDFRCPYCGTDKFFLFSLPGDKTAWGCGLICEPSKMKKGLGGGDTLPTHQRAILWPLFCEINGIGNAYHDVTMERVEQSPQKIEYMIKFANNPRGILLMRGGSGLGKTYAAMAICEFFTRTKPGCIFITQKQMAVRIIDVMKGDKQDNYTSSLNTVPLLVVDDFGTADMTPNFLAFFLDLINTRMQWTNRGTVITTNLDHKKFITTCGEALNARIMSGQFFEFKGANRRKKPAL